MGQHGDRHHEELVEALPRDEVNEIMAELRVALPGIQVIFGFLLIVPFSNRFETITATQEKAYFLAFLAAAAATILLTAPSTIHRIERRPGEDQLRRLLKISTLLTVAGSACTAIAMGAVVYMVTDIIFDRTLAGWIGGGATATAVFLWFGLPIAATRRTEPSAASQMLSD